MSFRAPRGPARFEQEIKKSRFIGIVVPMATPEEAEEELEKIRAEFPDATHHCWAYVLGDPGAGPKMRYEDAGEPAGTAGRPILNVLQRREVGDALVVVVRYFGGVKLGAGGLARAYSATASRVLEQAELETVARRSELFVRLDYGDEQNARRLLGRLGIEVRSAAYGEAVVLGVRATEEESALIVDQISAGTGGRAKFGAAADAV
jgi:uncharacterized YigZ family protein